MSDVAKVKSDVLIRLAAAQKRIRQETARVERERRQLREAEQALAAAVLHANEVLVRWQEDGR